MNHRVPPGAGELDIAGFVDAVRACGYDGAWGVEVLSAEFRGLPLSTALPNAHTAAARFLDRASASENGPVVRGRRLRKGLQIVPG